MERVTARANRLAARVAVSARRLGACCALAISAGCGSAVAPDDAKVQFAIEAPFCGGTLYQWQFSVDSVVVGTETLRGSQTSQLYPATMGPHVLGAKILSTSFAFNTESRVTLRSGGTFVNIVSLYCS